MVYIRVKKISHQSYAYLVENISTARGPRQKVLKYLGKVYAYSKISDQEPPLASTAKLEFLRELIARNLQNHGFIKKNNCLQREEIAFSLKDLQLKTGVVALNDGFLCNHTLQQLTAFKISKNLQKDGYVLAKNFLQAGLPLSREEFVNYYHLLK
ncbi:hypothetical protein J4479_02700 [Candidatus Woesearchaeota archaeon]|nr:hypothetical protein [Candidatus Woesearchaeota archaeon]